jgi:hypothetical protein
MVRLALVVVALLLALPARADPPHARAIAAEAAARKADDETLEQLAMRIAERLGARQSADGDGSIVLRVPARAETAGKSAGYKAAAKPTPVSAPATPPQYRR